MPFIYVALTLKKNKVKKELMEEKKEMSMTERIHAFLQGRDPMEHIVSIECGYQDERVSLIYVNNKGEKRVKLDDFKPFVWAKNSVAVRMFDGDKNELKRKMREYGINCIGLTTKDEKGKTSERLEQGYRLMFYATKKMNYQKFLSFFSLAKTPIYPKKNKKNEIPTDEIKTQEFLAISPIEQYMIVTGKRFFKGYENYDDLKRLVFDLETQGLNPKIHAIDQIGIRTNKGFERIITIEGNTEQERRDNELKGIIEFLLILRDEKPDIIAGHNSENFDWEFIEVRCEELGTSLKDLSLKVGFKNPIYKRNKETVLKLGGEVEYFKPTVMWGHTILDSLHAARRSQAQDSNMKSSNLKYVTKYLKLNKRNRVYVNGQEIGTVWRELSPSYAFNNTNGDWYKLTEKRDLEDGYEAVSGRYIIERYLLDDLWETDKVELKLNESNFLVGKLIPTTFQRACTMGTAGIWKLIMLAWCYENRLAIPAFGKTRSFTGGLSRLLRVGYVDDVAKLDYNSLYPSIMLTWNITNDLDISNSMLAMLEYVLSEREKYKALKAKFGKESNKLVEYAKTTLTNPNLTKEEIDKLKWDAVYYELKEGRTTLSKEEVEKLATDKQYFDSQKVANDKKQNPLKILGNSVFGSYGSPSIFPFGNISSAEKVTCIGRACLRLMIYHFSNMSRMVSNEERNNEGFNEEEWNYKPIVGDSFLGDTPLYIMYKENGCIDIKPISEIIDENAIEKDCLGREYDYSNKPYWVLCRSGWHEVNYVYRHKTDKQIYRVQDGKSIVDVTEDHSLFNEKREKIKPTEINEDTKLEYYKEQFNFNNQTLSDIQLKILVNMVKNKRIDRMPISILNAKPYIKEKFLKMINYEEFTLENSSKTMVAGIQYLIKCIERDKELWEKQF